MKAKRFLFSLIALSLSLGLFTACNNNKPKAPEAPAKLEMSAPQVTADESGLIALGQFPVTDPHLTVTVGEGLQMRLASILFFGHAGRGDRQQDNRCQKYFEILHSPCLSGHCPRFWRSRKR